MLPSPRARQAMKERCVSGLDEDVVAAVQSVINTLLLHIKTMEGVDTAVSGRICHFCFIFISMASLCRLNI